MTGTRLIPIRYQEVAKHAGMTHTPIKHSPTFDSDTGIYATASRPIHRKAAKSAKIVFCLSLRPARLA